MYVLTIYDLWTTITAALLYQCALSDTKYVCKNIHTQSACYC